MAKKKFVYHEGVRIVEVREYRTGDVCVTYSGTVQAFISADFLPREFFEFGKSGQRNMNRSWFERKTGKSFPERVHRVHAEPHGRRGMLGVKADLDGSGLFYVPSGDTWPSSSDQRYKPIREFKGLCGGDDSTYCGPLIATDFWEREDGRVEVRFRGTEERLLRMCLVNPEMLPQGVTPTGRKREQKTTRNRFGKIVAYLPSWQPGAVHVTHDDVLNIKTEQPFFDEVRAAAKKAALRNAAKQIRRALDEDDDEDDEWG